MAGEFLQDKIRQVFIFFFRSSLNLDILLNKIHPVCLFDFVDFLDNYFVLNKTLVQSTKEAVIHFADKSKSKSRLNFLVSAASDKAKICNSNNDQRAKADEYFISERPNNFATTRITTTFIFFKKKFVNL